MTGLRRVCVLLVGVLAAAYVCAAPVKLTEDPPPFRRPRPGDVTGTLTPADKIVRVRAVSRVTGKKYTPAKFDKTTGKFVFKNLPGDATYDVCVDLAGGRGIEGIDLDFAETRMVRLAARRRKQLGLRPERTHRFTQEDADWMVKWLKGIKDFTDHRRALYIRGHGKRATMLMEGMRTSAFHASKGTIVWRIELWYFEERFGGWEKLNNQERVLRRVRTTPDEWRKIHLEYYPGLSVHVDTNGYAKPIEFKIPEKSDPSRGRIPGTAPQIDTKPHVLGIDVRGDEAAAE